MCKSLYFTLGSQQDHHSTPLLTEHMISEQINFPKEDILSVVGLFSQLLIFKGFSTNSMTDQNCCEEVTELWEKMPNAFFNK